MKLMHENNILKKTKNDYKGKGVALQHYYDSIYSPYKLKMESITFDESNLINTKYIIKAFLLV